MPRSIRVDGLQAPEPRELAEQAGLTYVSDEMPGIRRVKRGRGFAYKYDSGRFVQSQRQKERIASLAIPPAWNDVWICRQPTGHLQATGRDSRDRKQYLYHDRWCLAARETNFARLPAFGRVLPKLRRRVARDFRGNQLNRRRVLAGMTRLLDAAAVRVGSERYCTENASHGLSTLLEQHVDIRGRLIELTFRGKGGKPREIELKDRRLADFLRQSQQQRDANRLFAYEDEAGQLHDVDAVMLNEYLEERSGEPVTAKDFRTWHATVLVVEQLAGHQDIGDVKQRERQALAAIDAAAEMLGNTRSVCRAHYVHPGVLDAYVEGRFDSLRRNFRPRRQKRFSRDEQLTLHVLDQL